MADEPLLSTAPGTFYCLNLSFVLGALTVSHSFVLQGLMILRNSCHLPNPNSEAARLMSGHRNIKRRCGESHLESPAGCGHGPAAGCVLSKLVQLPTPPLSKHQLKRLEEHKYQSAGRSLLEPLMQGYWEWLVGRVPAWIAPNLITIIGLLINISTTLLLVYYCPTATEQVSDGALTILIHGYCHLVAAGTVFLSWRTVSHGPAQFSYV